MPSRRRFSRPGRSSKSRESVVIPRADLNRILMHLVDARHSLQSAMQVESVTLGTELHVDIPRRIEKIDRMISDIVYSLHAR